jgi:hypothetical protein
VRSGVTDAFGSSTFSVSSKRHGEPAWMKKGARRDDARRREDGSND